MIFYIAEEASFAPGIAGDWPRVIAKPGNKNARLVKVDPEVFPQNANVPLPLPREELGRSVRNAWIRWAKTQPNPKPSWMMPYDDLAEADKEADRQIGEQICWLTMLLTAANQSVAEAQL